MSEGLPAAPPAASAGGPASASLGDAREARSARVRAALADLLGEGALAPALPVHELRGMEAAVGVRPHTDDEVGAILRRCSEEGWRVVPAGAGTWLAAGNPVADVDVVLSVARMDRIVQYEPADLTLTVGAGVTLRELARATAREGQWLPLDPPGSDEGTLGAALATASAGGLSTAYGAPRDLCLGLRLVTGDGRALSLGGRVVKNVAGFDLVKLAVGSWGTLGVITRATVRLFPRPEVEAWLIGRAASLEELVAAARRAVTGPVVPAAVELVERPSPSGGGGREALLRVRLHGLAERVAHEAALLADRMRPLEVERREGQPLEEDPLLPERLHVEAGSEMTVRMLLLPAELGDLVGIARGLGRIRGRGDALARAPLRIVVDAARGSLTTAIPSLRADPDHADAWVERIGELRRTLVARHGDLVVLHGPPEVVGRVGAWEKAGGASRVIAALEAQFDPAGILSSGRLALEGD